ncbi:MAG: 4-hydroxy-tetrahydrodipicolinate reductase [bacterium]
MNQAHNPTAPPLCLALIGYGKMGKEIERLALERGIPIVGRYDIDSPKPTADELKQITVGIHYATPQTVVPHIEEWSSYGQNLVIGTTGWHEHIERVRSIVEERQIGLVYASNFSIGVNILLHLIRSAGKLFNRFPEYDVSLEEIHHREKLDSPSGTALSLAKVILETVERKKEILNTSPIGKIKQEQLHISSSRVGTVVGKHEVIFDSLADTIEISHTAKNRSGFALGSLLAAQWIIGKQGLFTMDDVLSDILSL